MKTLSTLLLLAALILPARAFGQNFGTPFGSSGGSGGGSGSSAVTSTAVFVQDGTSLVITPATSTANVLFKSSVTFQGDAQSIMSTDTFSAAQTINWQQRSRKFIQLYGNVTSSVFNNMADGGMYELVLCQDAAGSRTFAWPAGTVFPAHGVAPTLTLTANRCDMFTIQFLSFDASPHVMAEALNN